MVLIDNNTVRMSATFTEPSLNADGSPLTDLARTTIYVKIGTNPAASVVTVPASQPSGGGNIATTFLVAAQNGSKTTFNAWVTATDLTGNESSPSVSVTFEIDRVGPVAPVDFLLA